MAADQRTFCERCTAQSTERQPGNISTVNGIGRKFYGGANACEGCGSVVRTLWWTLVDIPIVPLGSYRYKRAGDLGQGSEFWARRTAWYWPQILTTWVVGLALGTVAIAAIWYFALRDK